MFYATIKMASALRLLLNSTPTNPIKALYWFAVINAIVAVPVLAMMMSMAAKTKIMCEFVIGGWPTELSWILFPGCNVANCALKITRQPVRLQRALNSKRPRRKSSTPG